MTDVSAAKIVTWVQVSKAPAGSASSTDARPKVAFMSAPSGHTIALITIVRNAPPGAGPGKEPGG